MTITVSQLGNFLKALIDNEPMLTDISVSGEVSTLRKGADAVYFTLKDENAQVDCFWYSQAVLKFKDGDGIVATGRPTYYAKGGRLSFCVSAVKELNAKGAAKTEFLLLKDRLEKEGLFAVSRKKNVPANAHTIGVVTSKDGAVIHDILTVSARRNPCVEVILFPVRVQGEESAAMLAAGLDYFCKTNVNAVIVGRGGGSDEDLAAFNSEITVCAVARCTKPVISAVGHENNYTLCDLAADVRAATPSEAAEICTLDTAAWKSSVLRRLNGCFEIISGRLSADIKLTNLVSSNFVRVFEGALAKNSDIVSDFSRRLAASAEQNLSGKLNRLKIVSSAVEQNNPMKLLAQGYSALLADGLRLTSVEDVDEGQQITAYLKDGRIFAEVKGKEKI